MKVTRLVLAFLSIASATAISLFADDDRSDSLQQEISELRRSVAELLIRIESLEGKHSQRADDTRENGSLGALGTLPEIWTSLISGRVMAISVGAGSEDEIMVAIYDDSNHLNILRRISGAWTKVASTTLLADAAPRLLLTDLGGDAAVELIVVSDKLRVYTVADESISLAWSSHESFRGELAPRLAVADFNADGRKDVAVLHYKEKQNDAGQSLYVYSRTLSERWDFGLTYVTTFTDDHGYHSTAAMTAADFSGDGRPEIVVGNDNGNLWLVTFDGHQPAVRKRWKVPSGGAVGPGLAAGNLDDDDLAELLVGTNGGEIFVFEFDEQLEPQMVATATAGRLAYGVEAGDVDGDGRDEFVLTRGHLDYAGMTQKDVVAEVWKLSGAQLDRIWQQETIDLPRPVVHDLDNDGRDDVIVLSQQVGGLAVLRPHW